MPSVTPSPCYRLPPHSTSLSPCQPPLAYRGLVVPPTRSTPIVADSIPQHLNQTPGIILEMSNITPLGSRFGDSPSNCPDSIMSGRHLSPSNCPDSIASGRHLSPSNCPDSIASGRHLSPSNCPDSIASGRHLSPGKGSEHYVDSTSDDLTDPTLGRTRFTLLSPMSSHRFQDEEAELQAMIDKLDAVYPDDMSHSSK